MGIGGLSDHGRPDGSAGRLTHSAGKTSKTMPMGQKTVGIGGQSDHGQPDGSAGRLTHSAGKANKTMLMGQKSVGIGGQSDHEQPARAIMSNRPEQSRATGLSNQETPAVIVGGNSGQYYRIYVSQFDREN